MERGLFRFRYGKGIVEFLHVDNLVQAHILAARALTAQRNAIAVREKIPMHHVTRFIDNVFTRLFNVKTL